MKALVLLAGFYNSARGLLTRADLRSVELVLLHTEEKILSSLTSGFVLACCGPSTALSEKMKQHQQKMNLFAGPAEQWINEDRKIRQR